MQHTSMLPVIKNLIKGSAIYGIGSVGQRFLAFLLVPIYTRFLTPSDYGIVAVTSALSSMLVILLDMGFRGAVVRHYYKYAHSPQEVRRYLGTVFIFFLLASIPSVTALTLLGEPLFQILFKNIPFRLYVQLTLWTALFTASGGILLSLYRAREQAVRYVSLQLGQLMLSLGLIILFVVALRQGALGKIQGEFLSWLCFFCVFTVLILRESSLSFSMSKLGGALVFGLPLVPHAVAGWALAAADRLLLERMTPLSEVGLYNLGYQVGMVPSLAFSAIEFAWSPMFYNIASTRSKREAAQIFSQVFRLYVIFASTLVIGVFLFAKEIITIIAAEPFHDAYVVVPPVAVGYLFQGLYFMSVTPIFYTERTVIMPFLTGTAACVNIGLNLLWIPKLGIIGASYATLVSFAVLFGLAHCFAQRYYQLPHDYRKLVGIGLLATGVYFLNQLLSPYETNLFLLSIKAGILLAFIAGLISFKIISLQELKALRKLFSRREEADVS